MQTAPFQAEISVPLRISIQRLADLRVDKTNTAARLSLLTTSIDHLEHQIADRIVNGETSGDRLADFGIVCHHDDATAASQLVEQLKVIEDRLRGQKGQLVLLAESEGKNGHWLYLGRLVGEEIFFDFKDKRWSLPTDGHVDVLGLVKSDMPIELRRKTEPWKASFQKIGKAESLELVPSTRAPAELTHEFYIGDAVVLERIIAPLGESSGKDYKNGIRHAIKCLRKLGIDPGKYPMLIDSLKEDREQCLEKIASLKVGRDRYRMENEQEVTRSVSDEAAVKVRGVVRELKLCLIQAVDLGLEDNPLVKSLREEYQL